MTSSLRANRMEVSDRFPVLGLTIRTDPARPWIEVTLVTDPALLQAEQKARRTISNFYSTRALGPLPTERGETVYLVPTEVLARFIGSPKLYCALVTFADPSRSGSAVDVLPSAASPWIGLGSFTGRSLRRASGVPNRQGGLAGSDIAYGGGKAVLEWSGDTVRQSPQSPAAVPSQIPAAANKASAAARNAGNGATNGAGTPAAAAAVLDYDDGFDPHLWSQPQGVSLAQAYVAEDEPITGTEEDSRARAMSGPGESGEWDAAEALGEYDENGLYYPTGPTAQELDYGYDENEYGTPQAFSEEDEEYAAEAQSYSELFGSEDAPEEEEHRHYADSLGADDEGVDQTPEPMVYGQSYGETAEDISEFASQLGAADGYAGWQLSTEPGVQATRRELPSPIGGTTLTRSQGQQGSVTWEVDQITGFKHIDGARPGSAMQSASLAVVGPTVTIAPGNVLMGDFDVRWRFDGSSVGDVEVVNTRTGGSQANLHVTATIGNDDKAYTTNPPSEVRFAGLPIRFHYRFTRAGSPPLEADTDVMIFGNGTASKVYRWS